MPKKQLNILLIDDDKEEHSYFLESLQKFPIAFNLHYCSDTQAGVNEMLSKNTYNIIFLDLNMPGQTGLDFLKEIKAHAKYKHIPVILYTASASDKDVENAYNLGAHYFLIKPYAQVNLIESFNKIFRIDWTLPQPQPSMSGFVINFAFA